MGEQVRKGGKKILGVQLHQPAGRVKRTLMPIENKTEKIVMRVKPSYKKRVEVVADALGVHVVRLFEDALESYEQTMKVKKVLSQDSVQEAITQALAKPDTKPTDTGTEEK